MDKKQIEQITAQLETGVKAVFTSENYKNYLDFLGKFHSYSLNNTLLIWVQCPGATHVAGYTTWQKKFKRQVRKGEKSIKILAPCPHSITVKETDDDGSEVEHVKKWTSYKPVSVFDISQTEGPDVPTICKELSGAMDNYAELMDKLKGVSPVPVTFEDIKDGSHGYYHTVEKRIAIKAGMSERQTIKTTVHEIAHSLLHSKEQDKVDRDTAEVQAESVAYVVCNALGMDTSEYSFGYVAGWGSKDAKELMASMDTIKKAAQTIIDGIAA